jgi:hydrogenase/urease accessory protein HupE
LVGIALGLAVGAFAALARFDRERVFYPTVTIVTASYYALFAVLGSDAVALAWETASFLLFGFAAVLAFRRNLWIAVGALAGHAVFDSVHGRLIDNPGLPLWWPAFCLAFDVAAAAFLAFRMLGSRSAPARGVQAAASTPEEYQS